MNWYYDQGGERQGPVEDAELDRLIASGVVRPETLVWSEGMANWAPLKEARPSGGGASASGPTGVPDGWIRCTATGRYFPPSQIVYLDGKPYSAEAKAGIVQGVMQGGQLPVGDESARTGPAWEHRATLGFFPAIWQTLKAALFEPSPAFEKMKRTGGLGTPLGYYVLLASIGGLASVFYQFALNIGGLSSLPPEVKEKLFPFLNTAGPGFIAGIIGSIIAMPLLLILKAFIFAGVFHLSLMICGGAKQPFETTFRTYCYAFGSGAIFQLIPFCAAIGGIWAFVCLCIGLAKTHEIGTGRAVCAALLPTALCCFLLALFFGAIFGAAMSAQGMHH